MPLRRQNKDAIESKIRIMHDDFMRLHKASPRCDQQITELPIISMEMAL